MNPAELVLGALRDRGLEPHPSGDGWSCRCPAHEDRRASLSISAGEDGCALLCCHASCSIGQVRDALGINKADLFPKASNAGYQRGSNGLKRMKPKRTSNPRVPDVF